MNYQEPYSILVFLQGIIEILEESQISFRSTNDNRTLSIEEDFREGEWRLVSHLGAAAMHLEKPGTGTIPLDRSQDFVLPVSQIANELWCLLFNENTSLIGGHQKDVLYVDGMGRFHLGTDQEAKGLYVMSLYGNETIEPFRYGMSKTQIAELLNTIIETSYSYDRIK